MSKTCVKCKTTKGPEFFPARGNVCRACIAQRTKEWREANVELRKAQDRRHYLKFTYNLTVEQYDGMVAKQDGRCAICREETDVFHVDHNHEFGFTRGLLCGLCNRLLGNAKDSVEILKSAISYLNEHEI